MILEFKIYELKEESRQYNMLIEKYNQPNEFIVISEELVGGKLDCYKAHQLSKDGLVLLGGMKLNEYALNIPKSDLKLRCDDISYETTDIDVPKKCLTMDIIEEIQRLND